MDDDERVDRWGRIGVALTVVAPLHFAALVARGLAADPVRVPWGNMYEFTLAGASGSASCTCCSAGATTCAGWALVVTGFEVVVLMLDVLVLYMPAGPLVPALHSYWLVIHVMAAVIASGAFAVGAIALGAVPGQGPRRQRDAIRPGGYLAGCRRLPVLDRVAYRLHAFGFPIWTFAALVAGPIWAEYAWGRYWNWDPKEVWAFITWVVYAAYLHARATAGWSGKAAAMIALVGFATLLFNFVGINFFFGGGSLHSYAGEPRCWCRPAAPRRAGSPSRGPSRRAGARGEAAPRGGASRGLSRARAWPAAGRGPRAAPRPSPAGGRAAGRRTALPMPPM